MTKPDKLRVGIAGYGVVGKRRRIYIDEHPHLKTVAVSDQKFEKEGHLDDGVKVFTDYKDLLKEKLDILFVSLPNYLAKDATIGGLMNDMHVFCEKPPGRDVSDIEEVIKIEKTKPYLTLKYGFNHRYHDSVQTALGLIRSKELGEIINMRGVYGKSKIIPFSGGWRSERQYAGGGILLDQGIHMVDLMRLFCGEFVEVKSFVSNKFWNHDVEDNAYAIMRDNKGRIAMLHSSATQWQHKFMLDIALTKGFIELHGILSGSKSYGEENIVIGANDESAENVQKHKIIKHLEDNSWRNEIWEFADAVVNNKKIIHGTSGDALATMKLVYAIYYADEDWRNKFKIAFPEEGGKSV